MARLHKLTALLMISLPFVLGWFLYQNPAILSPIRAFSEALQLWEGTTDSEREVIKGEVTEVSDNYTLNLRDREGAMFKFRLTGVEAPAPENLKSSNIALLLANASKELNEIALSNQVQVAVTYRDAAGNGLGVLYVGKTNVNALMVRRGLGQVRREYLRGLELGELYALLRSERAAREQPPQPPR
ncbi:MAG: thermonuclease family protein [Verrucomicrobia bacterium]|jgi:endonuclease YncB( thermonuclease family)|nr:thermonuclease family protein [Verrucomicrobiota bacterium]